MSLFNLDDNYNYDQDITKAEFASCHIQTIRPGQRWNYPFLFEMIAVKGFWYNTQKGHRDKWYSECNLMIGGR